MFFMNGIQNCEKANKEPSDTKPDWESVVIQPVVQPPLVITQAPPLQTTPPAWLRLWYWFRSATKAAEPWHWCLGFALCASFLGSILWLYSSNLHGLILFLVVPGLIYPLELLSENTRKYQAIGVLICNYVALGITALAFTFYTSYS